MPTSADPADISPVGAGRARREPAPTLSPEMNAAGVNPVGAAPSAGPPMRPASDDVMTRHNSAELEPSPARDEWPQFGPVHPTPLKEQVASELKRLIDEGTLQRGQQLPSERELADRLGVSRGTVREGIRFLHALGYLEVRHGLGTFVNAASGDADRLQTAWRDWTRRHAHRVHDLLELRKGIESFAAELASVRQLHKSIERMAKAVDQMRDAAVENDVPALVAADIAFHEALCEGSGNAVLAELVKALGQELVPERAATFAVPGRPEESVSQHSAILEAVRAGDAEFARIQVLMHLESVQSEIDRAVITQIPGDREGASNDEREHEHT